jgi:predicted nucleic acid-binding Zn ribbon protein
MAGTCTREGCERDVLAKGLCASHYYTERMARQRAERRAAPRPPCRYCGADLRGRDPRAVYCSVDCKEALRESVRQAAVAARRTDRVCIHCGGPIAPSKSTKATTCSRECGVAHQNGLRQAAKDAAKKDRPPCVVCGHAIPEDRRGGATYCSPACNKVAQSSKWRARAPHYMRQYLYGITAEEYTALLEAQGNRCAICGSDEWPGKGNGPHVDHCHVGGQVRGLLCGRCNTGLGQFGDDPVVLRAAAAYLERHM